MGSILRGSPTDRLPRTPQDQVEGIPSPDLPKAFLERLQPVRSYWDPHAWLPAWQYKVGWVERKAKPIATPVGT